jgi:glycosyltransferase involved in cell wall biosynthesis
MLLCAREEFLEHHVDGDIVSTGREVGPYALKLMASGYQIYHIPFKKSPGFLARLYRLIRQGDYDVVHLHTERANFWLGFAALAARPERVVRAVHNTFDFRGFLRLRRKLQRRLLHHLGVIHVAVGANVQEVELRCYGLPTRLVPNWYDSRHFTPPSDEDRRSAREFLGVQDGETVLVSVGNCSQIKNHDALIRAVARLPVGARPLYLHVGVEEPGRPERGLAETLGVAERVRFLGAVSDMRRVYSAADLFVMPSLHEGRSVAVLEALATGLPALLADVPGLRDLSDPYPHLCYAEPSADSVTAALVALLEEDPNERRARASSYPRISRAEFGLETGVAVYSQLYWGREDSRGKRRANGGLAA